MKGSRRKFLQRSTMAMTGIGLIPAILKAQSPIAANDKINIGLIGCRSRGFHVLKKFPEYRRSELSEHL